MEKHNLYLLRKFIELPNKIKLEKIENIKKYKDYKLAKDLYDLFIDTNKINLLLKDFFSIEKALQDNDLTELSINIELIGLFENNHIKIINKYINNLSIQILKKLSLWIKKSGYHFLDVICKCNDLSFNKFINIVDILIDNDIYYENIIIYHCLINNSDIILKYYFTLNHSKITLNTSPDIIEICCTNTYFNNGSRNKIPTNLINLILDNISIRNDFLTLIFNLDISKYIKLLKKVKYITFKSVECFCKSNPNNLLKLNYALYHILPIDRIYDYTNSYNMDDFLLNKDTIDLQKLKKLPCRKATMFICYITHDNKYNSNQYQIYKNQYLTIFKLKNIFYGTIIVNWYRKYYKK